MPTAPETDQWPAVLAAIAAALADRSGKGAAGLRACWERTAPGDHAQRCVLAHYLADAQDTLADEVSWDERALAEFAHVRDADLAPAGIPSAQGLAPSLHLNLGDGYRRQGRPEPARRQLDAGLAAAAALPHDGYGGLVRTGLERLHARLAGE